MVSLDKLTCINTKWSVTINYSGFKFRVIQLVEKSQDDDQSPLITQSIKSLREA